MDKDIIQDIPKGMEKFFGCSGKMVKPSIQTVESKVKLIGRGQLATLSQLQQTIADDFSVQTACPASITKALQILSKVETPICYWRLVKKKGQLISKFPDGMEGHAMHLELEGFSINREKKSWSVIDFGNNLFNFY